tara:strand:+ start:2062 stop:2223 length:162 start_codon:yes stop_codon:yes gene_type:complete
MKVYLIIISVLVGLFLLCCIGLYVAGYVFGIYKQFKESKRNSKINTIKDERKK